MPSLKHIGIAAAVLAAGVAWGQTPPRVFVAAPGTEVPAVQPTTLAVESLNASADNLRESIEALQQQSPSPARDAAIARARAALGQAQIAMADAHDAAGSPPNTATLGAGPQLLRRELACTPSRALWVCR